MWSTCYSCRTSMKLELKPRNEFICQISWKSIQWEPSCSGRTDMKLIVAFRSFANVSKNYTFCQHGAFISFVRIAEKKLFSCAAWTGFREQNGVCLRRGTNWTFKYKAGYFPACSIADVLCFHRYSCDRWPHLCCFELDCRVIELIFPHVFMFFLSHIANPVIIRCSCAPGCFGGRSE